MISENINELTNRFDKIHDMGFIPTKRVGDTGVGYTFETLMDIEENNHMGPDFQGIELKTYRVNNHKPSMKHNLFTKEPTWIDNRKTAQRIRELGYIDTNGRIAWYSSVKEKINSQNLVMECDEDRVFLKYKDERIAFWTFGVLNDRLNEKLAETVYIGATSRGKGTQEEFHFINATYYGTPSIKQFTKEITSGNIIVELRMHVNSKGVVRNHGTAFRIIGRNLTDLYATTKCLREFSEDNPVSIKM